MGYRPRTQDNAIRYDSAGGLLRLYRRDDGTALVEGRAAKPGVMTYMDGQGNTWRELIPEDELHDPESLATLGRAPLTLQHPAQGFVTPDNAGDLIVGDVDGEVAVEKAGGFVRVKLAVRRRDALDAVGGGVTELSPGYVCAIDPTPGTHPTFGRYDAIQRRRRYNHLAIVDTARGGRDIALRADGAAYQIPEQHGGTVNPILVAILAALGVDRPERYDTDAAALGEARTRIDALIEQRRADAQMTERITVITTERDTLTETVTQLTEQVGTLTADRDAEKGRADALQARVDAIDAEAAKAAEAAERAELTKLAERVGVKTDAVDIAAAPLADIRRAIAAAHLDSVGSALPDDATDGHVGGVLSTIPTKRGDAADKPDPWRRLDAGTRPTNDANTAPNHIDLYHQRAAEALSGGAK
jgi:hypothetical protein